MTQLPLFHLDKPGNQVKDTESKERKSWLLFCDTLAVQLFNAVTSRSVQKASPSLGPYMLLCSFSSCIPALPGNLSVEVRNCF